MYVYTHTRARGVQGGPSAPPPPTTPPVGSRFTTLFGKHYYFVKNCIHGAKKLFHNGGNIAKP